MCKLQRKRRERINYYLNFEKTQFFSQKEASKQKQENDALVEKLKQMAEESKKVIDSMVIQKQPTQLKTEFQEDVSKKELENAKKQIEFYEKRIKQIEKSEESQSVELYQNTLGNLKKLEEDIEKAKVKNSELKKFQRGTEKILNSNKPVFNRNDVRKELEILMTKLDTEKKQLEKKKENKEKILKKIDEIEAKYKDVCQKSNVAPIQRPDFTVQLEEFDFSSPTVKSIKERSKSEANFVKPPQNIVKESKVSKTPNVSEQMILLAKQNADRMQKNITSFEKSHNNKLNEVKQLEIKLTSQKAILQKDFDKISEDCNKAHLVLKELQSLPKDSVISQSKFKTLLTEDDTPSGLRKVSYKNNQSMYQLSKPAVQNHS